MKHKRILSVLSLILALSLTGCGRTAELEKQVDTLQKYLEVNMKADIENWDGSYVGFGDYRVHRLFDDSAILQAHQTGDTSTLSEQDKETLQMALDVIDSLALTEDMSDYEKEKAIYDWQVKYVRYDESHQAALPPDESIADYNYHPYGVLKYGQAICVGNATTFKLMMGLLGIESHIIHSTEQGEHAWNLVKIGDGWYHVDITFDGSSSGEPSYTYFNVPDTVKQNSGYPWDAAAFPKADALEYCYTVQNCTELADLYAFPEYLYGILKDATEAQNINVSFADGSVIDYDLTEQLSNWMNGAYLLINADYALEDGTVVQNLRLELPMEESEYIPEYSYDYEQMSQIIADIFAPDAVG